jgi:hypothetical protein
MKIITRRSQAKEASARWKAQYGYMGKWRLPENEVTYNKLKALGHNPDPDAVDEAIGNPTWTSPGACSACRAKESFLVEVGEEPDWESRTAYLCFDCLKEAYKEAKNYAEKIKKGD